MKHFVSYMIQKREPEKQAPSSHNNKTTAKQAVECILFYDLTRNSYEY